MNPTPPYLIVTIDTECDKSPGWRTAAPVRFRAVTEAIPESLQPLFEDFGIRPTYFLSPEVIAHPESCAMLREARNVELASHLHGDYVVPQIKTWTLGGSLTDEMQLEYGPELEQQKLAVLTELFVQQFGYRPLSFRAGRFGIGPHSGRILHELGYLVDSSVTPHVTWTTRHGEKRPDFQGCQEWPYTIGANGNLRQPGVSSFLEVPVTILPPGALGGGNSKDPIWFRPWYSDADTLCRVVDFVLAQAPRDGCHRPLVMMFHNVELLAGASPYPQTKSEVTRYLDILKRTFAHVEKRGINSSTVAEYYRSFSKKPSGEGPDSISCSTFRRQTGWQKASPRLSLPAGMVERVIDRHQAQSWFKYVFRERESRWDCWQPSAWVAEHYPRDAAILSLGCGVGFNLLWLAEQGFRSLHGCDIDSNAIAAGRDLARLARAPVKLWVDDLLAPKQIPRQKYAVIEALVVTIHLENFSLRAYLDSYLPFLAEEGVVIIDAVDAAYNDMPDNQYCTQDREKPVEQRRPSEYKVRQSREEIEAALASRGMSICQVFKEPQTIPKTVYVARRRKAAAAPTSPRKSPVPKPRVLLIADVPDWIFARHCKMLERALGGEFEFTIQYMGRPIQELEYDLIYPLEYNLVPPDQITQPAKWITGIRSHTSWQDRDWLEFLELLANKFQRVHAVSRRLQNIFKPFLPAVEYVAHGVDMDFFTTRTRADQSGRGLRLGWAGSRMNPTKGFNGFIAPLGRLPGVELVFCGHLDVNLSLEGMRDFYDSLDAYVCTSLFEGNNNSLLEAAAMQRAIITTDNGTVPEYLSHGESALIVERDLASFSSAVLELRDNPAKRAAMGERARAAVAVKFEWKAMAEHYRAFFRTALQNREAWRPADVPLSRKIEVSSIGFH